MAKKITKVDNGTVFNVQPIHIVRIKTILEAGHSPVIIHGDGSMFAGKDALIGSDHHREFNSGVPTVNENEAITKNAFRAIYKKGDELPATPKDVIKEFYADQTKSMQVSAQQVTTNNFGNAITVADPKEADEAEVKE
jgi:hypothetical protein